MKSYQWAYIKWYFSSKRKQLCTYIGTLLVIFVFPALMLPHDEMSRSMPLLWACILVLIINIGLSMVLPILQYRYLMKKQSCDLYLPLPFEKKQMFFLQYGLGVFLLVIPNVIFFLAVLCQSASWQYLPYYAVLILGLVLISLCLYSISVFLVCKCNSLWDAICAVFGFVMAQVLLVSTINNMMSLVIAQVLSGYANADEFLPMSQLEGFISPILAAVHWLRYLGGAISDYIVNPQTNIWEQWLCHSSFSLSMFLFFLILWGLSLWGGVHTYVHRKGEDSEQKTTSKWIYPLLMFVITGCLILQNNYNSSYFWVTIMVFLVMNFLAERKITIRFSMLVYFVSMMILASGISYVMIETKGFNTIHEYYDKAEIEEVLLTMNVYDMTLAETLAELEPKSEDAAVTPVAYFSFIMEDAVADEVLIDKIITLQHRIVENDAGGENIGSISFQYELRNGVSAYRQYYIRSAQADEVIEIITYLLEKDYIEIM